MSEVYTCPAGHEWWPFDEPIGTRPDSFVCPVCGSGPRTEAGPIRPSIRLTWRRAALAAGFVLLAIAVAYTLGYLRQPHPVLTLRPHGGQPVAGLAFSPNCTLLATIGEDRQIGIREVPSGRVRLTFLAHSLTPTCIAFAPNGDTLFSGGRDGRIASWDPQTGLELEFGKAGQAVKAIAVSPDSRRIASADSDGLLKVWDIATREECL